MGYNTKFKGRLDFQKGMTIEVLSEVTEFFGMDARDHCETKDLGFNFIDLELTDDMKGIQWDSGTEKTYGMVEAVNYIIREMRKKYPDFTLTGEFLAQGEDIEDRWKLAMKNGVAVKEKIAIKGKKCECQECGHKWIQE